MRKPEPGIAFVIACAVVLLVYAAVLVMVVRGI